MQTNKTGSKALTLRAAYGAGELYLNSILYATASFDGEEWVSGKGTANMNDDLDEPQFEHEEPAAQKKKKRTKKKTAARRRRRRRHARRAANPRGERGGGRRTGVDGAGHVSNGGRAREEAEAAARGAARRCRVGRVAPKPLAGRGRGRAAGALRTSRRRCQDGGGGAGAARPGQGPRRRRGGRLYVGQAGRGPRQDAPRPREDPTRLQALRQAQRSEGAGARPRDAEPAAEGRGRDRCGNRLVGY